MVNENVSIVCGELTATLMLLKFISPPLVAILPSIRPSVVERIAGSPFSGYTLNQPDVPAATPVNFHTSAAAFEITPSTAASNVNPVTPSALTVTVPSRVPVAAVSAVNGC